MNYYTKYSKPALTKEQELELIKQYRTGNLAAQQEIIQANIKMVIKAARTYTDDFIDLDDYIQEGILGLIEALDKYDINAEVKFSTYATKWINGRIYSYCKNQEPIKQPANKYTDRAKIMQLMEEKPGITNKEISEITGWKISRIKAAAPTVYVSIDTPLNDETEDTIGDTIPAKSKSDPQKNAIKSALELLETKDANLLRRIYGIDCKQKSMKELAAEYQTTSKIIGEWRDAALRKLRAPRNLNQIRKELYA